MKGRGKRESPEKTRRPTASSGTIPTCGNPVVRPGVEPGSPWVGGGCADLSATAAPEIEECVAFAPAIGSCLHMEVWHHSGFTLRNLCVGVTPFQYCPAASSQNSTHDYRTVTRPRIKQAIVNNRTFDLQLCASRLRRS
ncbi:hypothetical protein PR048_032299 [Dryococelus australis]|uniref:Uncharacterized protein n=1 Tax=Dryococelus australis TaxID=614101 RepID=A0ABQ9G4N8_9NEOP|nr:hypothetical protein PR048_032299 [Dryococelus australis]